MSDDRLTAQELRALEWCQRQHQSGWSQCDARELQIWLDASPLNKVAFLRIEHRWQQVERSAEALGVTSRATMASPARHALLFKRRLRTMAWAAMVTVLLIGGVLAVVLPAWEPPGQYSTAIGSRRTVTLEDGSRVELNTDTRIRAFFQEGVRHVHLFRGEAFFDVRPDRARPFIVYADGQRIVVVGTRFSVRREAARLHVVVAEGKVRIDPLPGTDSRAETPPLIATRGDAVLIDHGSALVTNLPHERLDSELAWRSGFLMFNDVPLHEVAAEFNRYNRRKLSVEGAAAAAIRISGSFEATNLDAFVRLMRQGYHLDVEERGGQLRISA